MKFIAVFALVALAALATADARMVAFSRATTMVRAKDTVVRPGVAQPCAASFGGVNADKVITHVYEYCNVLGKMGPIAFYHCGLVLDAGDTLAFVELVTDASSHTIIQCHTAAKNPALKAEEERAEFYENASGCIGRRHQRAMLIVNHNAAATAGKKLSDVVADGNRILAAHPTYSNTGYNCQSFSIEEYKALTGTTFAFEKNGVIKALGAAKQFFEDKSEASATEVDDDGPEDLGKGPASSGSATAPAAQSSK